MNRRTLCTIACCGAGLCLALPAAAQHISKFSFNAGGGFTAPVGDTDGRMNTDFNINVGAGVHPVPQLGVMAEFGYNQSGLSNTILKAAGVPGGTGRIYSVTLNPIVHFNSKGRFDPYVIGGGGFYRRTVEFTQPTVDTVTLFDPFYGVFFPVAVPATQILASFTQNKGGLNIGGEFSVRATARRQLRMAAVLIRRWCVISPVKAKKADHGSDSLPRRAA